MDVLQVKFYITQNDKIYCRAAVKNNAGQIIYGLSPAVPKAEVGAALQALLSDLERTQNHVQNPETFGQGHTK